MAILDAGGQAMFDACRSYLEAWLKPLGNRAGEVRIRTEKRMTEKAYVGKTKKTLPVSAFLPDKSWQKLFDTAGNYQTVLAAFVPEGGEFPIAGLGLQVGLEHHPEQWRAHDEQQLANTLSRMRGRQFEPAPVVNTLHVFNWVLNHDECDGYMGTSIGGMEDSLDELAARCPVLQAWHGQHTWMPLLDQVDPAALGIVASVTVVNGAVRIVLNEGQRPDDLELALLPILPVETARVRRLA